jgi:DNA-binding MarR family transcriptional regulator
MPDASQLSVNDRVLLHLSRFATDIPPEEYPPETAQTGIASAVGISRTHVPRAVKGLIKDGLVNEVTARVKGHERRMNVYAVTAEGMRRAEEIWRVALEISFPVASSGKTVTMSGKDIEALVGRKRALAVVSQMRNGVVAIDETRRAPVRDLGNAPSVREFFGRDAELDFMEAFMESDSRMLVVLGNRGYGISSLARKFVDEQEDQDVLWTTLERTTTTDSLRKRLIDFGKRLGKNPARFEDVFQQENLLLVFDDYHSVSEEVVEFFSTVATIGGETKTVITAREETPAYNWFYHKELVDSKVVQELRIRGLDEASAKRLIGNPNIEADAFRRIMSMTRGQPVLLKLLGERDLPGLKANTVLTAEELRYMLFLRDKNA